VRPRVFFIQPQLTEYRMGLYEGLARRCDLTVLYSPPESARGFGSLRPRPVKGLTYQEIRTFRPVGKRIGLLQAGAVWEVIRRRPDAIIIFGNPWYASFWLTLLVGRLLGIAVLVHGHGLFKHPEAGRVRRWTYRVILVLAARYICYADIVRQSLEDVGLPSRKLAVADNSQQNSHPVPPVEKKGNEPGVLFVGRLRSGSGVGQLVRAVERLRENGHPVTLHVIGDGEELEVLSALARDRPWVVLHGAVYDDATVADISRSCALGCYPGRAGLSVVHLMSLSLPPVVASNLAWHQGPEPSYVVDGWNGYLFDPANPDGVFEALARAFSNRATLHRTQVNAFETYQRLTSPPLAERIWSIVATSLSETAQDTGRSA